jgi:hypothetical protein
MTMRWGGINSGFCTWRLALVGAVCGAVAGCGGDARVELSAADALTAVAGEMRVAFDEYHGEVETHDDTRESAVTRAFVERVRRDSADEGKLDQHASEFEAAMTRLRADRRVEWQRRTAAETQIDTIVEVAKGLRRIGIESLSLQDEVRRYLTTWMENQATKRRGDEATKGTKATSVGRKAGVGAGI